MRVLRASVSGGNSLVHRLHSVRQEFFVQNLRNRVWAHRWKRFSTETGLRCSPLHGTLVVSASSVCKCRRK